MFKKLLILFLLFFGGLTTAQPSAGSSPLDWAKKKCVDLGFKVDTERFGICVLQLSRSEPTNNEVQKPGDSAPGRLAESRITLEANTHRDCGECPEMVVIPAGRFLMGSPPYPEPEMWETPRRNVQIQSFWIAKYEVTQAQWQAVMGSNLSGYTGAALPVTGVSWNEVQQFIEKINLKTGQKYRLPSEAEWEYAARAGTTTKWSHGGDESKLRDYAWYKENSDFIIHAVGQKLPNAFGLHDMHGNVAEWTQDCWHYNYFGAPIDGSAWTIGCADNDRVYRGGSLDSSPEYLSSSRRSWYNPGGRGKNIGFRLAKNITQ